MLSRLDEDGCWNYDDPFEMVTVDTLALLATRLAGLGFSHRRKLN